MRDVKVVRDEAGFRALGREWDELLARSAVDQVFLTWDWLETWWDVYGRGVEPFVVTVREHGRLVAAAPLKLERRQRVRVPYRQLEFIGTGRAVCPDFLDFVIEAGREQELAPVMTAALLAEGGWDKLALSDITSTSHILPLVTAALASGGCRPVVSPDRVCPYVPLPATWAEMEARLSHTFRRNHRKKRRRLPAELRRWMPGEDLNLAFDELASLHQSRMETSGRGGKFRDPEYRDFHFRFSERAGRHGWLYLAKLWWEDRPIAARYGFLYKGVYYAYQSGFDPAMEDRSPSEVLLGSIIEELIAQGASEFNFLRGAMRHKFHWTDKVRETVKLEGWRRTGRGLAVSFIDRLAARRRAAREAEAAAAAAKDAAAAPPAVGDGPPDPAAAES